MGKKNLQNAIDALFDSTPKQTQQAEEVIERLTEPQRAPELTPEEEADLKEKLIAKQNRKRGRPTKWEDGKRGDGYSRTSIIVNDEKLAKAREIAFRESLTQKELFDYALDIIIKKYEAKHGVVTPTDRKRDLSKIF